ncbi:MAG: MBL fold metallo-hydrolase [Actinomycetes bacterium]
MSVVVAEFPDIGVTAVSRWIFNCYVVHDGGEGRPIIVDPGLPSTTLVALDLARSISPYPPVVVATHGHVDHVGGLPLVERHGATVCLPDRIRRYLDGEVPRSPGLRAIAKVRAILGEQPRSLGAVGEIARTARHTGYDRRGARFPLGTDHWLVDGTALPMAPSWQVLAVPGHTDDSTALWNERAGVLISGDAVLSRGGRAWFTPEICDVPAANSTAIRLRGLDVAALLPGHGRVVRGDGVLGDAIGAALR